MRAQLLVAHLLDLIVGPNLVAEASVHLPPRSTKWVAVFTGVERGKQVWKSTGLRDRNAALALARTWEAQARRQRQILGLRRNTASVRVRRRQIPDSASRAFEPLSQKEIAALLHMSERAVRNIERRALAKLKNHPLIRDLWREYTGQTLESTEWTLTAAEILALFGLVDGDNERHALQKIFAVISTSGA